jgi:chorismate synthase
MKIVIAGPQCSVDLAMRDHTIETHGHHDPCIVPRVIPVIENITAFALFDAWELQTRLNPEWTKNR